MHRNANKVGKMADKWMSKVWSLLVCLSNRREDPFTFSFEVLNNSGRRFSTIFRKRFFPGCIMNETPRATLAEAVLTVRDSFPANNI